MIARLKEEENGDSTDQFEVFRINDHTFQEMITCGIGNIFRKILILNARNVLSIDKQLYNKIKFMECLTIIEQDDKELTQFRDIQTGKLELRSKAHHKHFHKELEL